MTYDKDNQDTYFFIDEWGMVLTKPLWEGADTGERDSISRTAMAYKAWGDIDNVHATQACVLESYDEKDRYYWKVYRHPNNRDNDMSRDHILGLLLAQKFCGNAHMLKMYAKHLRWKISDKFNFTPDLWAWMKMLAGKWWWFPVFFLFSYVSMGFSVLWNKLLYKIAGFSEEKHQLDWYSMWPHKHATKRQIKIGTLLYPAYALEEFAWQLYVLKRNVFVRGLQKMALTICGKYNYLTRLLLGDKSVTQSNVKMYKQMTSWRWSTVLNETCRRHVEIIRKPEMIAANRLEEDLLKKIWDETR